MLQQLAVVDHSFSALILTAIVLVGGVSLDLKQHGLEADLALVHVGMHHDDVSHVGQRFSADHWVRFHE